MKAPDKIYCEECSDGIYSHIDGWMWDNADNIEYIRKDTLLKCVKELKAQMKIEAAGCSNMLAAGEWLAYDKLIKKIESL